MRTSMHDGVRQFSEEVVRVQRICVVRLMPSLQTGAEVAEEPVGGAPEAGQAAA
jgi:hypothetical protein